ncbi:MAG: nucleotide exchange factor GrpE [Cytophagaceae bacterium]|jgi:molecular chaperone GrpE|nr:nucleotide exchange factor GrpE [Cytophagaceae bacterium]
MMHPEEKEPTTQDVPSTEEVKEPVAESTQEGAEVPQASAETEQLKQEVADLKDKYIRLYSDFENFRKRTAREKLELLSNASEDVLKAVLPVLDDMERALKSIGEAEENKAMREGLDLVYQKFKKTLEAKGLKLMETIGTPFNPDVHEAITQLPAPSEDMKGKVIDEVEKGYFLHEKVIRFAKVVIGA